MTDIEEVVKALEALPEDRCEEITERVIVLITNAALPDGESCLMEERQAVVDERIARGFRSADPARLEALFSRYT